jgi:hypothetical protein
MDDGPRPTFADEDSLEGADGEKLPGHYQFRDRVSGTIDAGSCLTMAASLGQVVADLAVLREIYIQGTRYKGLKRDIMHGPVGAANSSLLTHERDQSNTSLYIVRYITTDFHPRQR